LPLTSHTYSWGILFIPRTSSETTPHLSNNQDKELTAAEVRLWLNNYSQFTNFQDKFLHDFVSAWNKVMNSEVFMS